MVEITLAGLWIYSAWPREHHRLATYMTLWNESKKKSHLDHRQTGIRTASRIVAGSKTSTAFTLLRVTYAHPPGGIEGRRHAAAGNR